MVVEAGAIRRLRVAAGLTLRLRAAATLPPLPAAVAVKATVVAAVVAETTAAAAVVRTEEEDTKAHLTNRGSRSAPQLNPATAPASPLSVPNPLVSVSFSRR